MDSIRLNAGSLDLQLSPSIGGSISAFEWTGGDLERAILRKCNNPQENVLEASCFPLVPYVNRIRDGRFTFRGREIRLTPNMTGDPSPLHGQGWLNAWAVEQAERSCAVLTYAHPPGEWPWSYAARHEFALDERGLSIRLSCRNTSAEAMPCGLGEHPYFPCGRETKIDTKVECAWTIDEHVLPVAKVPAKGRYDLEHRSACGQDLDNGFGGWGGEAQLSDPGWPYAVALSSPDAKFFQLYSPPKGEIFVAEPVTHANAALNAPESDWPELGMRVLDPGEAMSLNVRIEVTPK